MAQLFRLLLSARRRGLLLSFAPAAKASGRLRGCLGRKAKVGEAVDQTRVNGEPLSVDDPCVCRCLRAFANIRNEAPAKHNSTVLNRLAGAGNYASPCYCECARPLSEGERRQTRQQQRCHRKGDAEWSGLISPKKSSAQHF